MKCVSNFIGLVRAALCNENKTILKSIGWKTKKLQLFALCHPLYFVIIYEVIARLLKIKGDAFLKSNKSLLNSIEQFFAIILKKKMSKIRW